MIFGKSGLDPGNIPITGNGEKPGINLSVLFYSYDVVDNGSAVGAELIFPFCFNFPEFPEISRFPEMG